MVTYSQQAQELGRLMAEFTRGAMPKSCEAPDDESVTALSLSVCSRGNVRSETLRAFSFEEMKRILGKMV